MPDLHIPFHSVCALTKVVCLDSYQFVQAIAIRLTTWTTYFRTKFVIQSCFIQCYGILATENVIYWFKIKNKRILWISLLRISINLASYWFFFCTKNYRYTSPWLMFWLMSAVYYWECHNKMRDIACGGIKASEIQLTNALIHSVPIWFI